MRGGIPRINRARFLRLFRELSGIGASGDGSVHRPALSEAHLEARRLLVEKLSSLGGSGAVSVKCQLDKLESLKQSRCVISFTRPV